MCDVAKLKIRKKCTTPTEGFAIFVQKNGINIPICYSCWKRIGDGDWETGKDPKPTVEEIFGRRAKEEAEATPTEYKPKSEKKTEQEKEEEEDY